MDCSNAQSNKPVARVEAKAARCCELVCISHSCFAHCSRDLEVLYVAESCHAVDERYDRFLSHVLPSLCKFVSVWMILDPFVLDSCWFVFERLALPVTTCS